MKLSALLLGAALFAVPVSAFAAASPQAFLRDALEADNSEIMLGRLAQDRAMNPAVRDYGNTLVNDHRQLRNEVLSVGRRFGIRGGIDVSFEARQLRDQLMSLRGRDFDRVFINAMIDDHRQDIAKFRDEARERHGRVSQMARDELPTLQKHLDLAMDLDRRLDRGPAFGDRDRDRDRDRNGYSFRNGR